MARVYARAVVITVSVLVVSDETDVVKGFINVV